VERVKRQVVAFALAGLRRQALTGGSPPGT